MLLAALTLSDPARAQVVELDPTTDTVRVAGRLDGTLTGPAPGAAAPIGLRWVREHRAQLGLTPADLETLGEPTVETFDGLRQVRWPQEVDGIAAADAELRVNVAEDGRLINVLGSPSSDLPADTTPRLSKPRADAELTIYENRLGWRYREGVYDTIVDADTGAVLKRTSLRKSATANVWDNHPSGLVPAKSFDLSVWGTAADELRNPWMHVYADLDKNDRAGVGEDVVPGEYDFQTFDGPGCASATPCSWSATNRGANVAQNAVQAYYLANRFREHLASLGFDGFGGEDPLILETSDGEGTNNANMTTPPDGESPRMQMYLWSSSRFRSVNSGDDASILWHEYAHGLTERTVVNASGYGALNSAQAWAMAEGWSDFYAKDLVVASGLETDTAEAAEIHMGAYMDRVVNSTRKQAIDCPVGAAAAKCPASVRSGPGGFTYGDFGEIYGTPEVHADGEIWAQALWDLRTAIGAQEARRLVTLGLRLTPPEPTFLDGRDAIVRADQASGGAWNAAIWRVFAARGMGVDATMNSGIDPVEGFRVPGEAQTTLGSRPPALTNQRTVVFTFSGTSGGFECSLDGSAFQRCDSGQPWSVADGAHTFVVAALGDPTPEAYAFTVDATAPETTITSGPPPVFSLRAAAVAFTASEPASFTCSIDGGPAGPCVNPLALSGLGDGAHSVVVTATDAAGNADPTPARSDFSVAVPALSPPPPVIPRRAALLSASAPKTVSRKTGRLRVTLRGPDGAKIAVQVKAGKRVVGKLTRTLRSSTTSLALTLDRRRLRSGATLTVRVQASGTGMAPVTRSLKVRVKA